MSDPKAPAAALCLPPHAAFTPTKRPLPAGACDCHAHVVGPRAAYPLVPERSYEPPEAGPDAYRAMLDRLGFARGVLVTPSIYGTDNRLLADLLAADPARLRGVAVVDGTVSDEELARLDGLGVRGFRVNLLNAGGVDISVVPQLARRVAPLGWHLQLFVDLTAFDDYRSLLEDLDLPVVFDHMGYFPAELGCDWPQFRSFLALLSARDIWVKLSGAYRLTDSGPPYDALRPIAEALLEAAPERLVWGSDWPHVGLSDAMPDTGDLLNAFLDWCPDEALARRILVDNPARLYGF